MRLLQGVLGLAACPSLCCQRRFDRRDPAPWGFGLIALAVQYEDRNLAIGDEPVSLPGCIWVLLLLMGLVELPARPRA